MTQPRDRTESQIYTCSLLCSLQLHLTQQTLSNTVTFNYLKVAQNGSDPYSIKRQKIYIHFCQAQLKVE